MAAFHPDPSGAIRTYPDLKNVKTRLHTWPAIATARRRLTAHNRTKPRPLCTCVHLRAVGCALVRQNQKFPECAQTAQNRTSRAPDLDLALDPARAPAPALDRAFTHDF